MHLGTLQGGRESDNDGSVLRTSVWRSGPGAADIFVGWTQTMALWSYMVVVSIRRPAYTGVWEIQRNREFSLRLLEIGVVEMEQSWAGDAETGRGGRGLA